MPGVFMIGRDLRHLAGLSLVWLALVLPVAQAAQPRPDSKHAHDSAERHHLTPGEAARHAQRINGGGRVLSVNPSHGGYRVKLIKHGEVRVVFVPSE